MSNPREGLGRNGQEKNIDYAKIDELIKTSQFYVDGVKDRIDIDSLDKDSFYEKWSGSPVSEIINQVKEIKDIINTVLGFEKGVDLEYKKIESYEGPKINIDQSRLSKLLDVKSKLESAKHSLETSINRLDDLAQNPRRKKF